MTLLGCDPPARDLEAIQPRLRPFFTQIQAQEACAAAASLRALDGIGSCQADSTLAVLRPVAWLLPAEYASAYLRPCIVRLGGDPTVIDDLLEELRMDGVDQLGPLLARLRRAPVASPAPGDTAEMRQRRDVAAVVGAFGDLPPHRMAHVLGGARARALLQVLGGQPPPISVPAAIASLPIPSPPAPAEVVRSFQASPRSVDDVLR
eukprot:4782719-Alexandrium_andersonii.AAC.1